MRKDPSILLNVVVLAAALGVQSFSTPSTYGQETTLLPRYTYENWQRTSADDITALRRELADLAQLARAQQAAVDEQARRIEQLERELAAAPVSGPRSEGHPLPPAFRASPVSPVSCVAETIPSCQACGEGLCDEPWCGGTSCGCWDPKSLRVDIGGQYRLMFNAANFDFHPATLTNSQKSQSFFNQRFRTWLNVSPNENVEGYLQVEMGHILWGENFDFPKTYPGPFSPAGDRVGVELRRGYLIYKNRDMGVFRMGIQDWHDAFGESYTLGASRAVDDYDSMAAVLANSVWDFNVGGISYTRKVWFLGEMNVNAGAFALWEGNAQRADDALLFALDLDWPASQDHSVGLSVYYLPDHGGYSYPITLPGDFPFTYDSAWDVWLGVRARTLLWGIPLNAFGIYNTGQRNELGGLPRFAHDDAALKLEVGPLGFWRGELRFQTLYSTGDGNPDETRRNGFRTIAQSERDNFGSQGYWSYLILTSPHGPSDVNDLGVGLQNRGLGLLTIQTKYDYPICGRLSGVIAVGWLRSDAANPVSGSSEMGTELANMFAFDLGGGLVLDFGAAVLFTGDFYKAAPGARRPDELWEAFTRVQLEF